jgi:4-diphosphocytidyl-2-C-methyl-D-erythritol kinase
MRLLAPAKINLFLRVGPLNAGPVSTGTADGFHPLVSWMCTVGLFDTLILESRPAGARVAGPAPIGEPTGDPIAAPATDSSRSAAIDARSNEAEDWRVSLHCDDPAVPTDERNLVVRAARLLADPMLADEARARVNGDRGETSPSARRASFARSHRTHIQLSKRIPTGGGLGGGSSDAARALLGLNKLWRLDRSLPEFSMRKLSMSELSIIAAQLGSDVPFFLHGPSSVCTGRGEMVQPIAVPACKACVLILPGIAVPTPGVYRRLDEMRANDASHRNAMADWSTQPAWNEWTQLSAEQLLPLLANDLEAPAYDLHPELRQLQQQAQELLEQPVRMSGSGSSLFTLYDTLPAAEQAAENVREQLHVDGIAVTLAPSIDDDVG